MSNIVTRETVGEFVFKDPLARAAVNRGIPKDVFIRMLLDQCEHLQNQLVVLDTFRAYPCKIAATIKEDEAINFYQLRKARGNKTVVFSARSFDEAIEVQFAANKGKDCGMYQDLFQLDEIKTKEQMLATVEDWA